MFRFQDTLKFRQYHQDILTFEFLLSLGILEEKARFCADILKANFIETLKDLVIVETSSLMAFGIDQALANILKIQCYSYLQKQEKLLLETPINPDNLMRILHLEVSNLDHIQHVLWKVHIENFYDLLSVIVTESISLEVIGMDKEPATELVRKAKEYVKMKFLFFNAQKALSTLSLEEINPFCKDPKVD